MNKKLKEKLIKLDKNAKYVLFLEKRDFSRQEIEVLTNFLKAHEVRALIIQVENINRIKVEELTD